MPQFVDSTIDSYMELKNSGICIPKLLDFVSRQYALVEFIEVDFRQGNIAYSDQLGAWVFLDQMSGNQKFPMDSAEEELNANPFDRDRVLYHSEWARSVFKILDDVIFATRKAWLWGPCSGLVGVLTRPHFESLESFQN